MGNVSMDELFLIFKALLRYNWYTKKLYTFNVNILMSLAIGMDGLVIFK